MLSGPDSKCGMKCGGLREEAQAAGDAGREGTPGSSAAMEAFMVKVAATAGLDLVALVETDRQMKSARVIAAGRSGLSCVLTVPSLEDRGPLAGLVRENSARTGRDKILVTNEVFPRDGSWCDLIPMDSSVNYCFQPLGDMPALRAGASAGFGDAPRLACLAIAESAGNENDHLEIRALLAANIIAGALGAAGMESDHRFREERTRLLRRLTSSIAHEIKNPLTGIAAGVQYLARKVGPGENEEETVQFILTEINRLSRIVDDLYSVSKPPPLMFVETDIAEVVGKSLICLSEDIVSKEISTSVEQEEDVPSIKADPDRLQQVFINVIRNAVEASDQGGSVRVVTRLDGPMVVVEIRDQGCGIKPEEARKIFEPFHSTKSGGTGLGLYLSQSIVERHGGTIEVAPGRKKGTTVIISLPVEELRRG